MITKIHKIRIRYSESDQMKFTHHSNYIHFFEVGRIEFLREFGISYRELERLGIGLPVIKIEVKYNKPTFFDDEIIINTTLKEMPIGAKIVFFYEILNNNKEIVTEGKTDLAFMNMNTGKAMRCPEELKIIFKPYFD